MKTVCMALGKMEPDGVKLEDDELWLRRAIHISLEALPKDVPVGAILVDASGDCIAEACNRREVDCNPTGHAEIILLNAAAEKLGRWRLDGTTLYVTLEPCPMCAAAIMQSRVSRVVFGAFDPVMGACGSRWNLPVEAPISPIDIRGGLLEEECQRHLWDFFNGLRQK